MGAMLLPFVRLLFKLQNAIRLYLFGNDFLEAKCWQGLLPSNHWRTVDSGAVVELRTRICSSYLVESAIENHCLAGDVRPYSSRTQKDC